MNRLRLLVLLFGLALIVPLSFVVVSTYQSLEQEEVAELRFFGEALFDRIQEELAELVRREETRPVDAYVTASDSPSPLADGPQADYVLGWFQTGPDGEFQTPVAMADGTPEQVQRVRELREIHADFKRALASASPPPAPEPAEPFTELQKEQALSERYFAASRAPKRKQVLGQETDRFEEISPEQAMNLAQADEEPRLAKKSAPQGAGSVAGDMMQAEKPSSAWSLGAVDAEEREDKDASQNIIPHETWQAEIAPLQALAVDDEHVVLFRRVMVGNQVLRQGIVLHTRQLLDHLANTHFTGHPMSGFTSLRLSASDQATLVEGATVDTPRYRMERVFPRPFSFLRAGLVADTVPASSSRRLLTIIVVVLGGVVIMGLVAIERSAKVVTEHSRRRTGFVSSVTHELKTPLTNIRLYAEMLEQGMARDRESEEEYLRIIGSESKRLSRLIGNVLEFAKLERRRRPMDLLQGDLKEVLSEVRDIMEPKLRQEGYALHVQKQDIPLFSYDREAMVQILVNLIDNSLKFARQAARREIVIAIRGAKQEVVVSVTDHGPGIPKKALKHVFDDFYRAENDLTRNTKGTGIGLALVKRFVTAMHGTITVRNNSGAGCTFEMRFPVM